MQVSFAYVGDYNLQTAPTDMTRSLATAETVRVGGYAAFSFSTVVTSLALVQGKS